MDKHQEQGLDEPEELEDLEVPAEEADDVTGGRAPVESPVPIPYPN